MLDEPVSVERPERWWLLPLVVLLLGGLATVPFWISDLDQQAARFMAAWNRRGDHLAQDAWWWVAAYSVPAVVALVVGTGALVALVASQMRPHLGRLFRPALYLLLVLVIGSGVVTNMVLKDHWGRPRPRDTIGLGGSWNYLPPWQKGVAGRGKSFPCGHATVPAIGIACWLLWRRRRPRLARWALAGGVAMSLWIGLARMLVGAHWLSDVLWALIVMTLTAAVLHRLVMLAPQRIRAGPSSPTWRWVVLGSGGLIVAGLAFAVLLATPFYREVNLSVAPGATGDGPWRLEVVADTANITIEMRTGGDSLVEVRGVLQGFGLPGITVERRLQCAPGVVHLETAMLGLCSERSGQLTVVVRADDVQAIDVRVDTGDILVTARPDQRPATVSAHTAAGEVSLPQRWR